MSTRVIVWGEFLQEKSQPEVAAIYPDGMHETIAAALRREPDFTVDTACLGQPEHGMSRERLAATDVLVWWGHRAHAEIPDEIVDRLQGRVLEGMGLIVLHSGHYSKIFTRLMGTSCSLKWRVSGDRERLWNTAPKHPITAGIGDHFDLPAEEMYGEPFDVPAPDEVIFISWFSGGEVFRSGATWQRGRGRVFYFRPGHETHPTYHDANVQRVIANAIRWAGPDATRRPRRSRPAFHG